jgi:alanine dehydrogenase
MLLIDNATQERAITMRECIAVQEDAFIKLAEGVAAHRPRIDVYVPSGHSDSYYRWGSMEGAYDGIFACRIKSDIVSWPSEGSAVHTEKWHCIRPGLYCGLVLLFSTRDGAPLAVLNDGVIQHLRVGAGAGIGAKHLARADAASVGMLGSGGMARRYLDAFCAVRSIRSVKVFSPTATNREAFAREMSARLGVEVLPVPTARDAVRKVDILACCTDTMVPVFDADWLEPGMCVINVGAYEVPADAYAKFDVVIRQGTAGATPVVATDDIRIDIGHSPVAYVAGTTEERRILPPKNPNRPAWHQDYPFFADLARGRVSGRTSAEQITFYHNSGNQGLQFAAVGGRIYRNVLAAKLGLPLPVEWFVQDIRN